MLNLLIQFDDPIERLLYGEPDPWLALFECRHDVWETRYDPHLGYDDPGYEYRVSVPHSHDPEPEPPPQPEPEPEPSPQPEPETPTSGPPGSTVDPSPTTHSEPRRSFTESRSTQSPSVDDAIAREERGSDAEITEILFDDLSVGAPEISLIESTGTLSEKEQEEEEASIVERARRLGIGRSQTARAIRLYRAAIRQRFGARGTPETYEQSIQAYESAVADWNPNPGTEAQHRELVAWRERLERLSQLPAAYRDRVVRAQIDPERSVQEARQAYEEARTESAAASSYDDDAGSNEIEAALRAIRRLDIARDNYRIARAAATGDYEGIARVVADRQRRAEIDDAEDHGGSGSGGDGREYKVADDGTVSFTEVGRTYTVSDEYLANDVRDAFRTGDASKLSTVDRVSVSDDSGITVAANFSVPPPSQDGTIAPSLVTGGDLNSLRAMQEAWFREQLANLPDDPAAKAARLAELSGRADEISGQWQDRNATFIGADGQPITGSEYFAGISNTFSEYADNNRAIGERNANLPAGLPSIGVEPAPGVGDRLNADTAALREMYDNLPGVHDPAARATALAELATRAQEMQERWGGEDTTGWNFEVEGQSVSPDEYFRTLSDGYTTDAATNRAVADGNAASIDASSDFQADIATANAGLSSDPLEAAEQYRKKAEEWAGRPDNTLVQIPVGGSGEDEEFYGAQRTVTPSQWYAEQADRLEAWQHGSLEKYDQDLLAAARQSGIEPEGGITDANRDLIASAVTNAATGGHRAEQTAFNVALEQYDQGLLAAARQAGMEPEGGITDANRDLIASAVTNVATGGRRAEQTAFSIAQEQYDRDLLDAARQSGIEPEGGITDANRDLIASAVENAATGGARADQTAFNVALEQYDRDLLAAARQSGIEPEGGITDANRDLIASAVTNVATGGRRAEQTALNVARERAAEIAASEQPTWNGESIEFLDANLNPTSDPEQAAFRVGFDDHRRPVIQEPVQDSSGAIVKWQSTGSNPEEKLGLSDQTRQLQDAVDRAGGFTVDRNGNVLLPNEQHVEDLTLGDVDPRVRSSNNPRTADRAGQSFDQAIPPEYINGVNPDGSLNLKTGWQDAVVPLHPSHQTISRVDDQGKVASDGSFAHNARPWLSIVPGVSTGFTAYDATHPGSEEGTGLSGQEWRDLGKDAALDGMYIFGYPYGAINIGRGAAVATAAGARQAGVRGALANLKGSTLTLRTPRALLWDASLPRVTRVVAGQHRNALRSPNFRPGPIARGVRNELGEEFLVEYPIEVAAPHVFQSSDRQPLWSSDRTVVQNITPGSSGIVPDAGNAAFMLGSAGYFGGVEGIGGRRRLGGRPGQPDASVGNVHSMTGEPVDPALAAEGNRLLDQRARINQELEAHRRQAPPADVDPFMWGRRGQSLEASLRSAEQRLTEFRSANPNLNVSFRAGGVGGATITRPSGLVIPEPSARLTPVGSAYAPPLAPGQAVFTPSPTHDVRYLGGQTPSAEQSLPQGRAEPTPQPERSTPTFTETVLQPPGGKDAPPDVADPGQPNLPSGRPWGLAEPTPLPTPSETPTVDPTPTPTAQHEPDSVPDPGSDPDPDPDPDGRPNPPTFRADPQTKRPVFPRGPVPKGTPAPTPNIPTPTAPTPTIGAPVAEPITEPGTPSTFTEIDPTPTPHQEGQPEPEPEPGEDPDIPTTTPTPTPTETPTSAPTPSPTPTRSGPDEPQRREIPNPVEDDPNLHPQEIRYYEVVQHTVALPSGEHTIAPMDDTALRTAEITAVGPENPKGNLHRAGSVVVEVEDDKIVLESATRRRDANLNTAEDGAVDYSKLEYPKTEATLTSEQLAALDMPASSVDYSKLELPTSGKSLTDEQIAAIEPPKYGEQTDYTTINPPQAPQATGTDDYSHLQMPTGSEFGGGELQGGQSDRAARKPLKRPETRAELEKFQAGYRQVVGQEPTGDLDRDLATLQEAVDARSKSGKSTSGSSGTDYSKLQYPAGQSPGATKSRPRSANSIDPGLMGGGGGMRRRGGGKSRKDEKEDEKKYQRPQVFITLEQN